MTARSRLTVFLALGGLLSVATLIVLYFIVGELRAGAPKPDASSSAQVTVHPTAQGREPPSLPALPNARGSGAAKDPAQPSNEYTIGGVRVSDHRPGNPKPLDLPPNVHPPNSRQLPSSLTADISQQMRNVVRQCAKAVPADVRGAKPQFEAQVTVAIDNHRLSVVDVAAQVRDVEGPAAEAMRDCVTRDAVGLTVGAAGQEDLSSYGLRLAFILP